ncbi:hypothetical protein PRZ48_007955 [Zasmidium cellare]|uniref:Uncharacterized protein n=1 Tax=Zasmidium cellare TaxID=395010 RepID=A0ABR0EEH2_ZASCE|nr:hypothetical protein PRZ48_007955 [Zasmidium cellare]
MSAEDLPALRDFCDVGFLTYCQLDKKISLGPTNAGTVQPIAWFHIPYVKYDQTTLSAVTTVLNKLGHQGSFPDSPVSVPIGTDAFNALLATPIISQMADINIRHKHWFTTCAIASITIYNSWVQTKGSQAGHIAPGFLVHTAKVDEALERLRSENEEYERQNTASGRHDWPHKMRPMTHEGGVMTWQFWQSPPRPLPGQTGKVTAVAGPSSQGQPLSRRGDQSIERIVGTRGAENLDVTGSSISLTERMNEPFEGQRLKSLLEAGHRLLEAMMGTQQFIPTQAEWYSTKALSTKGWKQVPVGPQDLSAVRFLEGYVGVEDLGSGVLTGRIGGVPKSVQISFADPKDWKEIHHRHKALGEDDTYHSIVSYKGQVVAQLANNAPYPPALNPNPNPQVPNSQQMPGNLPEPHNWGDLVIPEYIAMTKRKSSGTFGPPDWWPILTAGLKATSPQAQEAIQAFLDVNDLDSVPAWPGITFPIGSLTYMQLLSSLEIKQIVWTFIQHKQMFGNAVIVSITAFDSGSTSPQGADTDNDLSQINFVAYVQKLSPLLKQMEADNRRFETRGRRAFEPKPGVQAKGPLSSKQEPLWPFPLRPVKNLPNAPSYQPGPAPGPGGSQYQGHGGQHDPVRGSSKNPYNQLRA